jgi:hypothetical protein
MFNQNKYLNGIYPGAVAVTVGIYIPTIFINSVFTSYHQDIQNAIIAHELGHIHHNDLSLQNLRDATIINGMIIDIDMECRADAYAATLTSKELMLNVLTILRPLDSDGIEYRINKLLDK